jgi:NADPH-dependent 7-cyano-7-deazaguanine reductase QueF-like protein
MNYIKVRYNPSKNSKNNFVDYHNKYRLWHPYEIKEITPEEYAPLYINHADIFERIKENNIIEDKQFRIYNNKMAKHLKDK